ncbi:Phosphatidylinositol 5-phosphate 4-kinase type-2 alpha [Linnemannia zychae]|nr:Phosphatidylinositol 5-phosphate 4-kinase type-2 alpha [Linnemannia zychae]
MWTFVWFLVGLLTGLTFAFTSPALQQRFALLNFVAPDVADKRKEHGSSGHDKTGTSTSVATTTALARSPQPQYQQPASNPSDDPLGAIAITTQQQSRRQRVLVESDPLHASELATTLLKKKPSKSIVDRISDSRSGKPSRGSLRRDAIASRATGSPLLTSKGNKSDLNTKQSINGVSSHYRRTTTTTPTATTVSDSNPTSVMASTSMPGSYITFKTTTFQASNINNSGPELSASTGMDSIPMDAESRWRDHHMKRQWAQSLIMESMEPVLSRHLRHAIKSVLHFTDVGPEVMDLKGSTQGLGAHWDTFVAPIALPHTKVVLPQTQNNSIQSNHHMNTSATATLTHAAHQQSATISHTKSSDHVRIPDHQQRTRSASINSLSHLLEAQRVAQSHRSRDHSTSSRTPETATSVPLTYKAKDASTSSVASPTIVVRGFASAVSTHSLTVSAEESMSKSTMMIEANDISESDIGLGEDYPQQQQLVVDTSKHIAATTPSTIVHASDNQPAILHTSSENENSTQSDNIQLEPSLASIPESNNNPDNINNVNGTITSTDQNPAMTKPRHSRLWSKMRKVVYGEPKQQQDSRSRNTLYLATGGPSSQSISDTHLSNVASRPASTLSFSASNSIIISSLSNNAVSSLGEDQILLQKELPRTPKVSIAAFETPPETAPNSPSQTLTPTSPSTRSRFGFSHNLPGLARRSSAKSPVAVAEVTTAESRVSQFMYAGQTSRPESINITATTRSPVQSTSSSGEASINNTTDNATQDTSLVGSNFYNSRFSTPNALERSDFSSALKSSVVIQDPDSANKQVISNSQLGRSKSASSAIHRKEGRQLKDSAQPNNIDSRKSYQDSEKFMTAHRRFRELGVLSPPRESFFKEETSLGPSVTRRKDDELDVTIASSPPSSTNPTWNGITQHLSTATVSSPHQHQTSALSPDGRPLSPSQMLSGISNPLPEQSKQERRRSAISFGGYFSNPSVAANRRTRDLTGHSISGLETDAQGEIIHLRRTSFFDKASPPTIASLASMIQTNLPSLSQSLSGNASGTNSPSLSRSPSKSYGFTHDQKPQLQGRPKTSGKDINTTAVEIGNSKTVVFPSRDLKKKVTPLKITPLLLSGVSSLPSPMFPPFSATIPRPLGSAASTNHPVPHLDRYFYNVDQVHEWNIPSYGRVRFTDHAPLVFHAIRERFQYTLADMDEALSQPMTVMKTPGKSDAIFFASHNHGRFLLKTLRGAEPDNLKGFLSDYLAHIQKFPNTLLPRYLGMYTFEKLAGAKLGNGTTNSTMSLGEVSGLGGFSGTAGMGIDRESSGLGSIAGGATKNKSDTTAAQRLHLNGTLLSGKDDGLPSKLVVVVLANVFDTPEVVHERYDFKGSNVGRRTLPVDGGVIPRDSSGNLQASHPNIIVPDSQPRSSMEKDSGWNDFAHRHSQWRSHVTVREDRSSSMYYEPKSDPIYPHLQSGGLNSSNTATDGTNNDAVNTATDISHLTLKEVDFQNRLTSGETQLIHLGTTRKIEILAQLEEDTTLLRKHGFMDYSMLVGIRIVPKRPIQNEVEESHLSHESSRRGSVSSCGSDADDSNLDSDNECSSDNGSLCHSSDNVERIEPKREIDETLERVWKLFGLSDEQLALLKDFGMKAQEAIRDLYTFGEEVVTRGNSHGRQVSSSSNLHTDVSITQAKEDNLKKGIMGKSSRSKDPPEVELIASHIYQDEVKQVNQQRRPLFDDDNDDIDPNSFQTVRYKPRNESHSSTRPKLSVLVDPSATGIMSMPGELPSLAPHSTQQTSSVGTATAPLWSHSSLSPEQSSFQQQEALSEFATEKSHDPDQFPTVWSQGVPSLGLPDGYEAVYYFGLIDVLQKYNLVKWLERNIKGANVRLLGSGNGLSSPMTAGPPSSLPPQVIHPGRSNPSSSSTSLALPAFYQLLPHASASEPSLSSSTMDPSSSVIGASAGTTGVQAVNPALSALLENTGSGHGSSTSLSSRSHSSSSRDPPSQRNSLLLDPNSSYSQSSNSTPISSARVSQEESTLTVTPSVPIENSSKVVTTCHSSSPSSSSFILAGKQQPRLSSSAPFTKSIGARLSQYSQYSHSSQQSQNGHQSGRSRDSRLSFDIRASNASEYTMSSHHVMSSSSSSPPNATEGVQIQIPTGHVQSQPIQQQQQQQQQSSRFQYQAEVSVEEPGRYAERLIEFMRGVLV